MNIHQAKQQIENAMRSYFTKDEFGNYAIPIEKQRPVFMMGPPGIGKTAIMEQIAAELNVGLVSYSMTHHTRQSAIGLPFIVKKTYGGEEYDVSEYTMSEIIASVYDMIESTGHKEGILFLDEINCVSETLAPAMLQFLQYKIFGRHSVPAGWIVVTAGNPPEFNNSVRDFDIVTWDRLKRIDVTPDYEVWKKEYAYNKGVHPAIITYLDIKPAQFYSIGKTVDGKQFVTARGWSDLSDMIVLYEQNGIEVDITLIAQYIQNPSIASEFAAYYNLYKKYRSDYQIDSVLSGNEDETIRKRAFSAAFQEKLALVGLIIERINFETGSVIRNELKLMEVKREIQRVMQALPGAGMNEVIESIVKKLRADLDKGKKASSMSADAQYAKNGAIATFEDMRRKLNGADFTDVKAEVEFIKKYYVELLEKFKLWVAEVKQHMNNAFRFIERIDTKIDRILVVIVTNLTLNQHSSKFISRYGCEEYFKHNKELLFYERQMDIIRELELMDIK